MRMTKLGGRTSRSLYNRIVTDHWEACDELHEERNADSGKVDCLVNSFKSGTQICALCTKRS